MYSKVKVMGHPLHPMLVAFPVALYTITFLSFVAYGASGNLFWFRVASIANWAAVLMAIVAAVPGLVDWANGIPRHSPARRTGFQHMILNSTALVLFLVNAIIYSNRWDELEPSAAAGIVLSLIGMALVGRAGFLGWKLVQDHHVGVQLSPEQERLEPAVSEPYDTGRHHPPTGAPLPGH